MVQGEHVLVQDIAHEDHVLDGAAALRVILHSARIQAESLQMLAMADYPGSQAAQEQNQLAVTSCDLLVCIALVHGVAMAGAAFLLNTEACLQPHQL